MNSCYYYAFDDSRPARAINTCSLASDEYPLIVNCAGNVVTSFSLTTDNAQGREDFYLIYMLGGTMDVFLEDGIHKVVSGNVILFPPHYHYRYIYKGGEELSYLWVHFTGSYASRFLEECGLEVLAGIYNTSCDNKITGGFQKMFDIFESGSRLWRQELACALEALILKVAAAVDVSTRERGFEKSVRYIHSSYHKDIQIPELAKMENLSYSGYIKLFKRRMGMPPSAYLIKLRMNAACDLLRNTDMSIKQVGVSVGYSDAHFFSRLFKKHTGVSPQSYRNAE
ncbi:MAG: helix-turn-helix transcriptional regulator [Clostridia bacterium]|nr:helix-turn-helix transcriptional regulator [Clostridia bacterium]